MRLTVYILRGNYDEALAVSHRADMIPERSTWPCAAKLKPRVCSTWKQLVRCWIQNPTRAELYDAAWRMAVRQGAIDGSHPLRAGDPIDVQTMEYARQDAEQVRYYISQLVNDPSSNFYIYG